MKRIVFGTSILCTAILLLTTCTQSGPCEGSLTLENPLPDTTVAVGDTLFINLANPPVFVSSDGRVSYFYDIKTGVINVDLSVIVDPDDENSRILLIIGEQVGQAAVELLASSDCLESSTIFNITITE